MRRKLTSQALTLLETPPPRGDRNELIRIEHAAGIGYRTIGQRYGLSASRIRDICTPGVRKIQTARPYKTSAPLPLFNASLADDFIRLCKEANISQRRLARHLGLTEHTVNHYANGKTAMPMYVRRYLQLLIYINKNLKMVRSIRLRDEDIPIP